MMFRRLGAAVALIAAALLAGCAAPPQQPINLASDNMQGSVERAERAQQVGGDCARALLRTLRGGLLSVPLKPAEGSACEKRTAY